MRRHGLCSCFRLAVRVLTKHVKRSPINLIRKSSLLAVLLALSLLLPLVGALSPITKGQTNPARGIAHKKMSEALLERARQSPGPSGEKTRVIFSVADSVSADQARLKLERSGAEISNQLDAVNALVANVPVAMLESLASSDEVSWVSADQEVRSLSAPIILVISK